MDGIGKFFLGTFAMSGLSALAKIRHLCGLDVGSRMVLPAVLQSLGNWIAFDQGAFVWMGADDRIDSVCTASPGALKAAVRLAEDCVCRLGDASSRIELFRRQMSPGVCVVDCYDSPRIGGGAGHMPAWADGLDIGQMLAVHVVSSSGVTGLLVLTRRGWHDRRFGREDLRRAAALRPHLSIMLDRRYEAQPSVSVGDGGILVIGGQGELLHACSRGRELLYLAADPKDLHCGPLLADEIALLARMASIGDNRGGDPAIGDRSQICIENAWGSFEIKVMPLLKTSTGPERYGIQIGRLLPMSLKMAMSVDDFDLSPRQRELAVLLGSSLANDAIASRLGITPGTVAGMVKDVYRRIGINSRYALRELLLHGA